jgi:hypothetical protein
MLVIASHGSYGFRRVLNSLIQTKLRDPKSSLYCNSIKKVGYAGPWLLAATAATVCC